MEFGGWGYSREYPVEKWMRDAKLEEIEEGTSDTPRTQAADVLYALTSPELFLLLVRTVGWTPNRYERWVAETVSTLLLPESP